MSGKTTIEGRAQEVIDQLVAREVVLGTVVAIRTPDVSFSISSGISQIGRPDAVTCSHKFQIGCLTKLWVALIALEMSARQGFDLERPISQYLGELSGSKGDLITVAHLLSHTAGYQPENFTDADVRFDLRWNAFIEHFIHSEQLFTPGKVFNYVHSGSVIVGEILRRVTGQSIIDLMNSIVNIGHPISTSEHRADVIQGHTFHKRERQFTRSEIAELSPFWGPSLAAPPMTVDQIAALGARIVHCTSSSDVHGLHPTSVEKLLTPITRLPQSVRRMESEDLIESFGMGCARYRSGTFGLSGAIAGQACGLRIDRDKGIVVAVGINSFQPHIRDLILNKIFSTVALPEHLSSQGYEFTELVGEYKGALGHSWTIAMREGRPFLRRNRNPTTQWDRTMEIPLRRDSDGRIFPAIQRGFESLGFFRDPDTNMPCMIIGKDAFKRHSN